MSASRTQLSSSDERRGKLTSTAHCSNLADNDHSSTHGDEVLFESFEASPMSENVLAAKGALQWDFPGNAVAIPLSDIDNPRFQEELALFLEKASTESIKQFAAHIVKAGSLTYESRDTVDPTVSIIASPLSFAFRFLSRDCALRISFLGPHGATANPSSSRLSRQCS